MERTTNKSQHTKLTLEKKILPLLLPGFELATFRSRARRSNEQAIPAPSVFHSVFNYNDPSEALAFWYAAILPVVNKHAPLKRKRVKHPKLLPWLAQDITQTMVLRDKLKSDKLFDLQRNKVSNLVRTAEKNYFNKLITDNRDTATV